MSQPSKEAASAVYKSQPLLRALSTSTQIKAMVESCALELSSITSVLKQEVAETLPLESVVQALLQSENVESKVQHCALELRAMNAALAEAINERRRLERALSETREQLTTVQAELFDTQAEDEKMRHLAFHDSLTGLPNRTLFDNRLDHALLQAARGKSPLALMFIDLDRFKYVNDIYGHDVGDTLLQTVATRLRQSVRAEDTVSRHGGDEFLCLLPGVRDMADLANIARKLIDVIGSPFESNGIKLTVTPSIGISLYGTDGDTANVLIRNADAAMYRAKQRRTGYAFFSETPKG